MNTEPLIVTRHADVYTEKLALLRVDSTTMMVEIEDAPRNGAGTCITREQARQVRDYLDAWLAQRHDISP